MGCIFGGRIFGVLMGFYGITLFSVPHGGFSIINLIGGRGMELLFSVPYTGLSVLYLIEVRDMGRYPG